MYLQRALEIRLLNVSPYKMISFINSYSQRFKYVKTRPGAILDEDVNDSLIDSQLKAQDTRSLVFNIYNSSLRLQKCFFMEVIQEKTRVTFISIVVTCTLNAIFSLVTCMSNGVILPVIRKTRKFHSPSFILLFCLSLSDFLVGVICQPFFIANHATEVITVSSQVHCKNN